MVYFHAEMEWAYPYKDCHSAEMYEDFWILVILMPGNPTGSWILYQVIQI